MLLKNAFTFIVFGLFLAGSSCVGSNAETAGSATNAGILNERGNTIKTRFRPPENYTRIHAEENSFAAYLHSFPLKPHGEKVKYFDGRIKDKENVYTAVLDIDIGERNLQQCADAVMRLRAEYLFKIKQFSKIHFNFTNGFKADYKKWMQGNRIVVNGNNVSWKKLEQPSNTYKDFRQYMDMVFAYAGTLSLSKELRPVKIQDINIGDVFIRGGSPGHAVIVIDVAKHKQSGEKIFMLAQSYMPAQDIQILINPLDTHISPWYKIPANGLVETPEWQFMVDDLKRFVE